MQTLEEMQQEVFEVNKANGWFDKEREPDQDCMLIVSEASEMFEVYRSHGLEDMTVHTVAGDNGEFIPAVNPKPEGFASELADVLIRVLDTAERRGIDLRAEYERKIAYNRTRGYRHGGKAI